MKVKEESEKVGLKLHIQKTKIMASVFITSWQIGGGKMRDFVLGELQNHCWNSITSTSFVSSDAS